MKKWKCLFVSMCLTFCFLGATGQIVLPHEDYPQQAQNYLWQQDSWILNLQITYTYNPAGQVTSLVRQYTNPGMPDQRELNTYQEDGSLSQKIHQEKMGAGDWNNVSRERYTWEDESTYFEYYENWEGAWVVEWANRQEHVYNGQLISQTTVSRDDDGSGNYVNQIRYLYAYNGQGRMAEEITMTWDTGVWVNSFRIQFFWTAGGDMDYQLTDSWNGSEWEPMTRTEWDHLDNGGFYYLISAWDESTESYLESMRVRQENDSHRNQTLMTSESKVLDDWMMVTGHQYTNTYVNDHLTERITDMYSFGGSWVHTQKDLFSAFASLGMDDPDMLNPGWRVFPNPTQGLVHLQSVQAIDKPVNCQLLDSQGNVISERQYVSHTPVRHWDLSDLPAGTYFFIIRESQQAPVVKPIVIQ